MLAIVTATLVVGCGNPVPTEKSDYVGEWQHPTMYLLITQDGSVKYKRLGGDATKSVEAPLKAFNGDNFTVGIGPMKTTFVVSEPPRQEGEKWVMVVDGVQLTRTATLR
jgi:hypothetical protein